MAATASSKVFPLTIDIYRGVYALAADGSYAPTYPVLPDVRKMPCSISYKSKSMLRRVTSLESDRITLERHYTILTPVDPKLTPRDKIIYTDLSKVAHTLFVEEYDDTDGLGINWTILATEKV